MHLRNSICAQTLLKNGVLPWHLQGGLCRMLAIEAAVEMMFTFTGTTRDIVYDKIKA